LTWILYELSPPPGSTVIYTPQGGDVTTPGEEPYPSEEEDLFPPGTIAEPGVTRIYTFTTQLVHKQLVRDNGMNTAIPSSTP
jgi:hypothetical protein